MRAFITGIAGFVGAHLTEHLLSMGDEVLGGSLTGTWGDEAAVARLPSALPANVPVIKWDITQDDPPAANSALRDFGPEAIYHLAAVSKADEGGTSAALDINIHGTRNVLAAARKLARPPRVLFVSSSYVYGDQVADTSPVAETTPLPPNLVGYGHTKREGEHDMREHVRQGGDAVIARAFQHAGPRQMPRFMLAEWCEQFLHSDQAPVRIRSSNAWLDLSDVRDVVRAYRLLVERGARGETYNVGSGVARRTGEIFDQLRALADPSRPFAVRSSTTRYTPIADIRKISAATGWQPQIDIDRTIEDTWNWFRADRTA
jgi:GDP-4-dehydro-6-deoxy-D-mannose reductase